jgi:hypothetical protein
MSTVEERLTNWQAEKRHCRDIYPGGCGIYVGSPNWDHRIGRNRRSDRPPHPTPEMALAACAKPDTSAEVLTKLGDRDEVGHGDVRRAARAHPNYPSS